jgi:hypothetical protein
VADDSIRIHAIETHILVGDVFTAATTLQLSREHRLKSILQPLCHGVFEINNVVRTILMQEGGTLHTLFPFTFESLQRYMQDIYQSYDIIHTHSRIAPNLAQIDSHLDAIPCLHDMMLFKKMFYDYIDGCFRTIVWTDAENEEMQKWMTSIITQQPNKKSQASMTAFFEENGLMKTVRLLTWIYFFHSTVTHDLASLTNRLVASPFVVPVMHNADADVTLESHKVTGKETSLRAMVAAHSTNFDVQKLNQRWGDVMFPEEDTKLKCAMNRMPDMLQDVEQQIRRRNMRRSYPSDALSIFKLNCSISV